MATRALSNSVAADLIAYARTRLVCPRVAMLVAAVVAAALAAGGLARAGFVVPLIVLMVMQFRLWDDLSDLPHDRVEHPRRVLVAVHDVTAFWGVLVASALPVCALLLMGAGEMRVLGYGALVCALAACYGWLPTDARRLRSVLVLLKYPAFVLLLAPTPASGRALASAAVLYTVLLAIDLTDEGRR